jgi:hypothetical protein
LHIWYIFLWFIKVYTWLLQETRNRRVTEGQRIFVYIIRLIQKATKGKQDEFNLKYFNKNIKRVLVIFKIINSGVFSCKLIIL